MKKNSRDKKYTWHWQEDNNNTNCDWTNNLPVFVWEVDLTHSQCTATEDLNIKLTEPKIYFVGYLSFKLLNLEKCWRDRAKSCWLGGYLGRVVLVLVRPKCGASHGGWRNLGWRRRRCGQAGPVPRNPGPAQPTLLSSDAVRIPAVLPVSRSSWCSESSSASSRSASLLISKVKIFFALFLDNLLLYLNKEEQVFITKLQFEVNFLRITATLLSNFAKPWFY